MQTFTATHHARTPQSSFVRDVYYNDQTKQCLVHISDGSFPTVRGYLYNDVPLQEYSALVSSGSIGGHYNSFFKTAYGPARAIFGDVTKEVEIRDAAVPSPREEKAAADVRAFSLSYTWEGKSFPSFTVETTDLMDAVQKLAGILNELGLAGAVIQVPVDELV